VGSFLQNKEREKVYVTGAEGIQCLLNNMEPYTHIQREDLRRIDEQLVGLEDKNYDLNTLIAAVIGDQPNHDLTCKERDARSKALRAAQLAAKAADDAEKIAYDFVSTAEDSPVTIVYAVDKINTSVSSSIINTEADVKSLSANLKDVIPENADNLAGIPSAKDKSDKSAKETPLTTQVPKTVQFDSKSLKSRQKKDAKEKPEERFADPCSLNRSRKPISPLAGSCTSSARTPLHLLITTRARPWRRKPVKLRS
jgi:hypothetical protein